MYGVQRALVAVFVLMLSGCTTAYKPYSAWGTGGFKERQLGESSYIVSFFGNGNTGEQQVWNFWIYRCAELTLQKGYDFFVLEPSDQHARSASERPEDRPYRFTMLSDQADTGTDNGYRPAYYTYYTTTVTTYSSKAVVRMYKNPVSSYAGTLIDAKVIVDTLQPYVTAQARSASPDRKDLLLRAAVEAAIRSQRISADEAASMESKLRAGF